MNGSFKINVNGHFQVGCGCERRSGGGSWRFEKFELISVFYRDVSVLYGDGHFFGGGGGGDQKNLKIKMSVDIDFECSLVNMSACSRSGSLTAKIMRCVGGEGAQMISSGPGPSLGV